MSIDIAAGKAAFSLCLGAKGRGDSQVSMRPLDCKELEISRNTEADVPISRHRLEYDKWDSRFCPSPGEYVLSKESYG